MASDASSTTSFAAVLAPSVIWINACQAKMIELHQAIERKTAAFDKEACQFPREPKVPQDAATEYMFFSDPINVMHWDAFLYAMRKAEWESVADAFVPADHRLRVRVNELLNERRLWAILVTVPHSDWVDLAAVIEVLARTAPSVQQGARVVSFVAFWHLCSVTSRGIDLRDFWGSRYGVSKIAVDRALDNFLPFEGKRETVIEFLLGINPANE